MLFPFDEKNLKTASYSVGFGKFAYQFDEDGGYIETELSCCKNELLRLPASSIVFVQCATHFRLPKYIALRFNLRIKHVHRGLLLGTGPLIDPGFDGDLLVPLHNLTSKDHYVAVNSHLIWIEFTKTTYQKSNSTDEEDLAEFDDKKKNIGPTEYLDKARKSLLDGKYLPIESSINGIMRKSIGTANSAIRIAKQTKRTLWGFGLISVLGVSFGLLAFLYTFVQATYEQVDEARHNMNAAVSLYQKKIDKIFSGTEELVEKNMVFIHRLEQLNAANTNLKSEIGQMTIRIKILSEKITQLELEKVISKVAE